MYSKGGVLIINSRVDGCSQNTTCTCASCDQLGHRASQRRQRTKETIAKLSDGALISYQTP